MKSLSFEAMNSTAAHLLHRDADDRESLALLVTLAVIVLTKV